MGLVRRSLMFFVPYTSGVLYEYIDPELSPQATWTLQHLDEISDILGLSEQVVEIWHMFKSCNLGLK